MGNKKGFVSLKFDEQFDSRKSFSDTVRYRSRKNEFNYRVEFHEIFVSHDDSGEDRNSSLLNARQDSIWKVSTFVIAGRNDGNRESSSSHRNSFAYLISKKIARKWTG